MSLDPLLLQNVDGVIVLDQHDRIVKMNPTAEQIYGYKLGEGLGKTLQDGLKDDHVLLLLPRSGPASASTPAPTVVGSQQAQRLWRSHAALIQNQEGTLLGVVSSLSQRGESLRLSKEQTRFTAQVIHDLRAPLHALSMSLSALADGEQASATPERIKLWKVARQGVERLMHLINDVMDITKIDAGGLAVSLSTVSVGEVIQESLDGFEAWAQAHRIQLIYEEDDDIQPVSADPDRLLQVMSNLISNALKHTPPNGHIAVRVRKNPAEPSLIQIDIDDTGPGIPLEQQARIFERFAQLSYASPIKGTGLGLSICRGLIELQKGRLWVESPLPGQSIGSRFSFTLPVAKESGTGEKPFWKQWLSVLLLSSSLFVPSLLPARPYHSQVRRVLEPGFIQLEDGRAVRLLGIDAPKPQSRAYTEALGATRFLLERKEVRLRYGLQERNQAGEWIAYAYTDDFFVNEELVRQGWFVVTPLVNDRRLLTRLVDAEMEARGARRGVWNDPSLEPYETRLQKKEAVPLPVIAPGATSFSPSESPSAEPVPRESVESPKDTNDAISPAEPQP